MMMMTSGTVNGRDEAAATEKVAILDAIAQYGKVCLTSADRLTSLFDLRVNSLSETQS